MKKYERRSCASDELLLSDAAAGSSSIPSATETYSVKFRESFIKIGAKFDENRCKNSDLSNIFSTKDTKKVSQEIIQILKLERRKGLQIL